MTQFTQQHIEKLEVLAGSRAGGARRKAALRVEDLLPLLALPPMKSRDVADAPTAADFNALRADLKEVHARLFQLAAILREKS